MNQKSQNSTISLSGGETQESNAVLQNNEEILINLTKDESQPAIAYFEIGSSENNRTIATYRLELKEVSSS